MDPRIREIGIPVRSVNWVGLHPGHNRDNQACLYVTMGQQGAPLFVLQIDPATGAYRQFVTDIATANYPTATLMSRSGRLYIGSSYAGHLLCFDPAQDALLDLGPIHPEAATFPCRMDEDAQGRIWIGSYGSADLSCYDPHSSAFTHYGRMDEVDMYNYPLVNTDGTVACLIRMTQPHVVVFDPATGARTQAGPSITKGEGDLNLRRGVDRKLYIESSQGDFLLQGTEAIPQDKLPPAPPATTLPDGSTFSFADAGEQLYRQLSICSPEGQERRFTLDYQSSGSSIFYIHSGPDECIYGSSILPLHLFRYDPRTADLTDLGQCSSATGEAYSMANLDHRMYLASYPGAVLSVYDPAKPYEFGDQAAANPRNLGRIDEISFRPRSSLAGPLGKVWTASIPDYGRWGGPLSYYDPANETKHAYYRICGDASCYTLAWLQERQVIAVGTNIEGGSGTKPKVDQAMLFLWDYHKEEKIWEGTLDRPITSINALLAATDGRLYGTVRGQAAPVLFVFDPQTETFTDILELPPGGPLDLGLQNGPDGQIYGFTGSVIYRLDPGTLELEEIIHQQAAFTIAGPILGAHIYFSKNHYLMAAELF